MPVNFNLLSSIAPTNQTVAQIPQQPNQFDEFTKNMLSGIIQGQQMQGNQQQMQMNKQGMQLNQMKIDKGKQEQAQTQALSKIGQQYKDNPKAYDQAVVDFYKQSGDPDSAQKYLNGKQSLLESTIRTEAEFKDMTAKERQSKFEQLKYNGGIAYSLTNLPDQQAVTEYSKYAKQMQNIDPNAPNPDADPKTILAYLHGSVSALMYGSSLLTSNPELLASTLPKGSDARKAVDAAQQKSKVSTELNKAQNDTDQAQQLYTEALKTNDPEQIKRTKQKLDEAQTNEINTVKAPSTESKGPAIQQTVDYITKLKQDVDQSAPGSPEQKAAQDKLDFAISQTKQDKGLWAGIKDQVSKVIGGAVGQVAKIGAGSPANSAVSNITPEQAAAELKRRGIQ
jgi:hypothetical protein